MRYFSTEELLRAEVSLILENITITWLLPLEYCDCFLKGFWVERVFVWQRCTITDTISFCFLFTYHRVSVDLH